MTMDTAKAQKRQQLIDRAQGKTSEPFIDVESKQSYTTQLLIALNWYAQNADGKQRKAWALSYFKKQKQLDVVEHLSDINDWEFHSLGVLLRLKSNGSFLSEKEEKFIATKTSELLRTPITKVSVVAVAKPVVPVVSIQDRIAEKAREVAGEIDGQLDDFVTTGKPNNYKISTSSVSSAVAKHVVNYYSRTIAEIEEAIEGEDAQLVEGYSNFTKPQLKRYLALLQSIVDSCEQAKKIIRKPRVRKAKPAGEIVKRMKFKKEDTELGIKSVTAASIIGASELWVYNTKYRKLQVYKAVEGSSLTVKGTSVLNYDTALSSSKTLRKPKEQLLPMVAMTKRPMAAAYKAIKCKEATPNGRINEECILFRTFQ